MDIIEPMIKIKSIGKNASYLTLALGVQKVISLTYFILLARNLGPEYLGKYYFAISFTTIFAILTNLGLMNVLTREVAKKKEQAQSYLGNILTLKFFLTAISLVGVFLVINLLDYDQLTRHLVYIATGVMILDSFTTTFFAVMRGFHNLKYESIGAVGFQLIVMVLGLSALYSGLNIRWVMSAMLVAGLFNFFYSWGVVRTKLNISLRPLYNPHLIRPVVAIAIPFGLYTVFHTTFLHLDSVLLSLLAGDRYVGLYQIAFKIIFALQFLPMAFVASFYPAMSYYWAQDHGQLTRSFHRAISYLLIISIPVAAGIFAIADKVVILFKSQFLEAILPLQIIILSIIFMFMNFPIGSLLNACDRQKRNTTNMGIVLAVSIIANLILIPKYQAVGASITVLGCNILMTLLGWYWVRKTISLNYTYIFKTVIKAGGAGVIMAVAAIYLKSMINVFAVIAVAAIIYASFLFLFRAFTWKEAVSMYRLFLHKEH